MKKVLIVIFLLGLLVLPIRAWALPTTLSELGAVVIVAFWTVFIVIAVCYFIIAGILFATARGDPQKLSLARAALIWGVVGAVVGILSGSILDLLFTWLG